jgi:TetR/AcrR family tetracycline transcriptional repressor
LNVVKDGLNDVKLSSVTNPGKLTAELIARAALDLLNEVGLDGLTMRVVAKRLDVQAAALYWHLKNKQQLLDAMAAIMFAEATDGLESPSRDTSWDDWAAGWAHRLRAALLRYRDGARVFAGTNTSGPGIEEQARTGDAYDGDNPYRPDRLAEEIDASRFPLTAEARPLLFERDTDAGFEYGLRIVLAGLRGVRDGVPDGAREDVR